MALGITGTFWFVPRGSGDHAPRSAREAEPAVLVAPLEAARDEGSRLLATGLTGELIATLMRFDALRVFADESPDQRRGEALPPAAAGAPAYVVAGRVERAPDRLRVTVRLTDYASKQVLWSQSYEGNSYYLTSASNGLGLAQTFTWQNARDNAWLVPSTTLVHQGGRS